MLQLDDLRALCLVVESGSFREAAERLHLTQPAISQRVRSLERDCGERLVDRRTRKPTQAGRIAYERGLSLLRAADHLEAEVRESSAKGAGELRVGSSDTNALYFLPPRVGEFSTAMPKVRVYIHCRSSDEVADAVARGELDLGVVTLPIARPELETRALFEQRLVLAVPRRHGLSSRSKVALASLAGQPMILIQSHTRTGALLANYFAQNDFTPATIMDSGSFEVIKRYVAEGLGVSIIPEMTLRPEDARGLVAIRIPGLPRVGIGLVWRTDGFHSAAARTFWRILMRRGAS